MPFQKGCIGWNKGKKFTEEHKKNISKALSGSNHPMWGKSPSEETKLKMSKAHKGREPWIKGKHHSEETRKKISELQKNGGFRLGGRHTEEAKRKTGLAKMGEKNPNWKGGIADYPNHTLMKKMRIQILKETNNKCRRCDQEAHEIHHVDFSKDNHKRENLIPLCYKCHKAIHANHRLVEKICSENLRGETCLP